MRAWLERLRRLPIPGMATGMAAAWRAGYGWADVRRDALAGLTSGIVAVPLSMALAIATGVPPQHGLYTAIIAGALIALTGGTRYSVSGPTAAFVVILLPIVQEYGIGGLLIATVMAGVLLVAMGLARLGALIQFVPYPVVLGFTAGIAVVIATLQVPDFFGLSTLELGAHFAENVGAIAAALPGLEGVELGIGVLTLGVLIAWPRLRLPGPAPLVGLVIGSVAGYVVNHGLGPSGTEVATIASQFTWETETGGGTGIPPIAPEFVLPWHLPGPDGQPLQVDLELIRALLGPAFAIAMLGAIESLLCAVVADGMTRTRHDPNAELVGQGLGNLVVPFFGGITATAALARTATNIRSGARSPLAAVFHALLVLLAVLVAAELLGMVPMAALAALLMVVAWNMAEAKHFLHTLRSAPAGDVGVLLVCFALTVFFDMVVAVAVGVGLASVLFIRRMASITRSDRVDAGDEAAHGGFPAATVVYDIDGPLFFGAADKAISALRVVDPGIRAVVVDMHDVPSIDGTALAALRTIAEDLRAHDIALVFVGLTGRQVIKLRRAGFRKERGRLGYCSSLEAARSTTRRWLGDTDAGAAFESKAQSGDDKPATGQAGTA